MTIKVGDKIPSISVRMMKDGNNTQVATDELFAGKKVALFAVPGAFTPTCSAKHLPSFLDNADALKKKGVDAIMGISVNDPFVMRAWGENANVGDKITLLSDGNGDFAKALGVDADMSKNGMGTRSRRYSMLIDNGVVKVLNLEEPGAFAVSGGDHMLTQI